MTYMWIAAGIIAAVLLIGLVKKRRRPEAAARSKVIELKAARSRKNKRTAAESNGKSQPCSLCRKPSKQLGFYTDENGTVIGVCSSCKPKVKTRQLEQL
ncbi:hypothetical protein M3223_00325 [Paenibacillus pasadenensis]|uniref:hypothetical protein n=1 Tax=Paenibacillus pasadenensis TaxID=217090 RepID=UPI0020412923|nr:hypothetical protein [Paenibacillus pasadenensis]MCM3745787.1 hypothetical protein [Paenibacillus pasadenensis]